MKNNFFKLSFLCRAGVLILSALFLVSAGCNVGEPEAEEEETEADAEAGLILMTWNIHNLFDGVDDGSEYAEFKKAAGWTDEKYRGRLNTLSAAINRIEPSPDIIMLQEVESLKVIDELAVSLENGYTWSHFANNYGAAVGVGIISRLPLLEAKTHSVSIDGETTPRPVLETRIRSRNGEFVIFVCHWKSKIGGNLVTESDRRASARVILRRMRELWEKEPQLGVIIAGDLNENYDEFFRQNASNICALLPDDPYCADMIDGDSFWQSDFFIISMNRPPASVHFPDDAVVLFSPWMSDLSDGSYYYKNDWETIDHFLISGQFFDNAGWEYETSFVVNTEPFAYSGLPFSYNARTGSGYSDHLPLVMELRKEN